MSSVENVFHWVIFGVLLSALPTLIVMGIHLLFLKDLVLIDYTKDILLIGVAITANATGILVANRIKFPVWLIWIIATVLVLAFLFLLVMYFIFFVGFANADVLESFAPNQEMIIVATVVIIAVEFVFGLITTAIQGPLRPNR